MVGSLQSCWSGFRVSHHYSSVLLTHALQHVHSQKSNPHTQIYYSLTCGQMQSSQQSANEAVLPEIKVPLRPQQTRLCIFQKGYDSKQDNNTLEWPALTLANRSLNWWFNAVGSGSGSALPRRRVWVCEWVHTKLITITMTNREAAIAVSGWVVQPFNEIQIWLVKRNGQTQRVEAIQACLNKLLRFAFGVNRNAFACYVRWELHL